MFLRHLNNEADKAKASGRHVIATIHKDIFVKHGARWKNLSHERKMKYEKLSKDARNEAEVENEQMCEELNGAAS